MNFKAKQPGKVGGAYSLLNLKILWKLRIREKEERRREENVCVFDIFLHKWRTIHICIPT